MPKQVYHFLIEVTQEDDGRFIADVPDMPGVMAYGATSNEACRSAVALLMNVIADRLQHGEMPVGSVELEFAGA